MSGFKRAVRSKVWLKIGLSGPSGSGKTYGALRLARGLAGPDGLIAFADTENRSSQLYSDVTAFDVMDIAGPFEPKKLVAAIKDAVENGYKVFICDSQTHFWKWVLSTKEKLDLDPRSNSFTNWGKVKPFYQEMLDEILQAPIHIIACIRAKDEYVLEVKNGKTAPTKMGMGAIAEPGAEYEYTVVFDIGMGHHASASKDRTGLFNGETNMITEDHGKRLNEWLGTGAEMKPIEKPKPTAKEMITAWELPMPELDGLKKACRDKGSVLSDAMTEAIAELWAEGKPFTTVEFTEWLDAKPVPQTTEAAA